jgi:peptidoglycan/LPS O-acetylase OafA/YrhL
LIGCQLLRPLQRGEPLSFRVFHARRAWRILPAFAVVLALYVLFPALREAPGLAPWWQFATFTLNLLIDYGCSPAFSHAWSLSVEEHFYLLFPLLAWGLARRPSRLKFAIVCSGVLLLGIALRTRVWLHDVVMDSPRNWFVEDNCKPTWMRLDGLLVGVMLATLRVYQPLRRARLQMRSGVVLVAGIAVSGLALWLFRDRTGLLANALGWPVLSFGFSLLVFAAADRCSLIGRRAVPGAGWRAFRTACTSVTRSLFTWYRSIWRQPCRSMDGGCSGCTGFQPCRWVRPCTTWSSDLFTGCGNADGRSRNRSRQLPCMPNGQRNKRPGTRGCAPAGLRL